MTKFFEFVPKLSIVFFICVVLLQYCEAMSKKQLEGAGKMMKNACMPKTGVTNDQVKEIRNGDFPEDKDVKCYIACIYTMAQVMKNGKLNYEAAKKQIDMMFPDDMKEPAKVSLDECKDVATKIKDPCDAAFVAAKCMYNSNPKNFVFP